MNIVLIGMMGSGKTRVGQTVAKKLRWRFYDTDQLIEKKEGISISKIFKVKGETGFRTIEKQVIRYISGKDQAVISTGGGVPCFQENWDALSKNGHVVWLKAKNAVLVQRLQKKQRSLRPLLSENSNLEETITKILDQREPFYKKAEWTIETDHLTLEEVSNQIIAWFKNQRTS